MLYYGRIDICEDIGVNKTGASKDRCIICHYGWFFNKGFKFQKMSAMMYLKMIINLNDIAILNICDVDYLCIIKGVSKSEAINL